MMETFFKDNPVENYVECFSGLNMEDTICRKYCALRLKCAIARNEQQRMLQMEDLINAQEVPLKNQ